MNFDFLGDLGFDMELGDIKLPNLDFLAGLELPCIPIPLLIGRNCGGGLELPKFDFGGALDFLGLLGQVTLSIIC